MVNRITVVDSGDESKGTFDCEGSKMSIVHRLMNKKNLKILILLVVGIVMLLIAFSTFKDDAKIENQNTTSSGYYLTTLDYCEELELKLKKVLSSIKGAGNISVMITVDGSPELVYAKDEDEKISSNASGSTTTSNSSSPIIVNVNGSSNALILTENLPQVKGVIVVSSGASDIGVKLDILNSVSTLLDISIDKISVLKGI